MIGTLIALLFLIIVSISFGSFLGAKYHKMQIDLINESIKQQNIEYENETRELLKKRAIVLETINDEIVSKMSDLEKTIEKEASIAQAISESEREHAMEAFSAYVEALEFHYNETEEEFDTKITQLKSEVEKWKTARDAAIQANLREQEIKEKENFYRISLAQGDLEDIEILDSIRPRLRRPEVLSKLIWTTYYQKNIGTLCNNVIGESIVSGIYKITDLTNGMSYIGQSVNIAQRWKDHVKAALGASNTVSNNKLYAAMQDSGVQNFTFEVLEKVSADKLNEKEKYWIEFYQSNIYGLNTVRGNK